MGAPKGNTFAKGNRGGKGQEPLYKAEYAELAFNYSLLGITDERMSEFFNVSVETIYKWKKRHKEFGSAIIRAKQEADANVVRNTYKAANGYEREEEEIRIINNEVVRVKVMKFYPPDHRAQQYWLNNRQRTTWKAKQADEEAPAVIIAVNVTAEEAKKIAEAIKSDI